MSCVSAARAFGALAAARVVGGDSSSSGNNNNGDHRHRHSIHHRQQRRLQPPRAAASPSSSSPNPRPSYLDGAPPSIAAESFDESSTGVTEFIAETKLPTDRGFYRLRGGAPVQVQSSLTHSLKPPGCNP
jgi:hypothetical protein